MQTTDRMQKLQAMLEKDPADPFLHFALGMEHKKAHNTQEAINAFTTTLKRPGYCVAYHQAALTYEDAGDIEAAKRTYHDGITAARKKGDNHAADEMEAALSIIE